MVDGMDPESWLKLKVLTIVPKNQVRAENPRIAFTLVQILEIGEPSNDKRNGSRELIGLQVTDYSLRQQGVTA